MGCSSGRYTNVLQLHTVVDRPMTVGGTGCISCRPMGLEPIEFVWTGPNGAEVALDDTRSEATTEVTGRYRVVVTDAMGARADVTIDVEPTFPDAAVVCAYHTTPASTSSARDGAVEAIGTGLEGWRFLWTNGVETDGPRLRDVPPGRYAALAVPIGAGREAPTTVHQCAPALVVATPKI